MRDTDEEMCDIVLPDHLVQLMVGSLPMLMDFFMHMDAGHTGTVALAEFVGAMRRFGLSNEEAAQVFLAFDEDKTGQLSLASFLKLHRLIRRQMRTQMWPRKMDPE